MRHISFNRRNGTRRQYNFRLFLLDQVLFEFGRENIYNLRFLAIIKQFTRLSDRDVSLFANFFAVFSVIAAKCIAIIGMLCV